jgi:hypothetical protein
MVVVLIRNLMGFYAEFLGGVWALHETHLISRSNVCGVSQVKLLCHGDRFSLAKTPLQSRMTLLKSTFFPAKFSFSKIQKKNLAGKIYFAKERDPFPLIPQVPLANRPIATNW